MFEEAKHFDFPINSFGRDEILKDIRHLFEGNPFAISRICDRPESPIEDESLNKQKRIEIISN
jgi:hypothetical protein